MMKFNTVDEFKQFIAENLLTTQESADILGCTRQNIDRLVSAGKLLPVKQTQRDKLFYKKDIIARLKPSE